MFVVIANVATTTLDIYGLSHVCNYNLFEEDTPVINDKYIPDKSTKKMQHHRQKRTMTPCVHLWYKE